MYVFSDCTPTTPPHKHKHTHAPVDRNRLLRVPNRPYTRMLSVHTAFAAPKRHKQTRCVVTTTQGRAGLGTGGGAALVTHEGDQREGRTTRTSSSRPSPCSRCAITNAASICLVISCWAGDDASRFGAALPLFAFHAASSGSSSSSSSWSTSSG